MYRFYFLAFMLFNLTADSVASVDLISDRYISFADKDKDGVSDYNDNCPDVYNPHQDDSNGDGIGDVCDANDCGCDNEHQIIYVCQQNMTRRVYCSALKEPHTYCGPCEDRKKECSECEKDDRGNITLCLITPSNKQRTIKGRCDDLQKYFKEDGTLKDSRDQCGPCNCAMIGDVDSDGDGVCDSQDECPDNPAKSKAGMCGCDKYDTDGDWVCDEDDVCPGGNDKYDADGDGVPDYCDQCEGSDDHADSDSDGIPDGCDDCPNSAMGDTDGDGVCDDLDQCQGADDHKDDNANGIPDGCEVDKCISSGNSEYEWIQDVKINNYFNLTNDNGGYGEYADPSLMFFIGDSLRLWMTPGYIDQVAELSMAIFVDWNGDRDFDDQGERVYDIRALRESGANIVIPSYARPGRICARFIVNYGRITGPCDPCIDGEVEDYYLLIKEESCNQTEETFNYDLDRSLQGLDEGWGWMGPWKANISGNPKARILQRSLAASDANSAGQKLGVLTPPNSNYMILREFDVDSEDLWMSFMYQRRGGSGNMKLILGNNDESVSISEEGVLSIGDVAGPTLPVASTHYIVVNVSRSSSGQRISAWVNPTTTSTSPDPSAAFETTSVTLDGEIDHVIFSFSGTDDVSATDHYLDEIIIGCTSASVLLPEQGGDNPISADMELVIAPNPIAPGTNAGITLSNASFFQGTLNLYTMSGSLVLTQGAFAGLNVIQTAGLQPGIYVLEIATELGVVTQQLVIQS